MKQYNFICECWDKSNSKKVVREWVMGDDVFLIGAKFANEEYRIKKILETYPTAKSLSADLKKTGNPKALQLAAKLDAIGNDQIGYYKIVKQLSGRTLCHWLGNLIGGPFAFIYQVIQGIKNFGLGQDAKQIIQNRI